MTNYIEILFIASISYMLGAVPFAKLIVKKATGFDIQSEGTGNVGAMNSYEVTGKRWIGILVLILDLMKGVAAILITRIFFGDVFYLCAIAGFFAVAGHNFNIFLKLKGGRGLATAAGVLIMINPYAILLWILMWLAGYYMIKKDVHVGNVVATLALPLMIYYTPEKLMIIFSVLEFSKNNFAIFVAALCFLVLARHFQIIIQMLKKIFNLTQSNNDK